MGIQITNPASISVPIGAVLAWLKNYTNTPALPSEFIECNGQVLNDAGSVYNGQTIPDLNGSNRFLRGNATSGGIGGSESHFHTTGLAQNACANAPVTSRKCAPSTPATSSTESLLPSYYEVVWIIRIK